MRIEQRIAQLKNTAKIQGPIGRKIIQRSRPVQIMIDNYDWAWISGALIVPFFITILITRGYLFHSGWIEYSADFMSNVNKHAELQTWLGAWNPALGADNSATLIQAPPMIMLVGLFGSMLGPKLFLAGSYFLMASGMFLTMRWWLSRWQDDPHPTLLPVMASLVFTVNGWVSAESIHVYYLLMYALLPLTFRCSIKAMETKGIWSGFWTVVGTLVAVATFTAYGIAFHAVLFALVALIWLFSSHQVREARSRIVHLAKLGSIYVGAILGLSAYWLLPTELGFHASYTNGTSWSVFTTTDMFTLSPYSKLVDVLRGLEGSVSNALAIQVIPHSVLNLVVIGLWLLPILALFRLILGKLDWTVGGLVLAAIVFLLWANGTNPPLGSDYVRFAALPFVRDIAYVFLKGPYKLIEEALFCLIALATGTVHQLTFMGRRFRLLGWSILTLLVVSAFLEGSPLLTGNLAGYMSPVTPPDSFITSMNMLASVMHRVGGGAATWLPVSNLSNAPTWAPHRVVLPLISGLVPPEVAWAVPTPISSRSVTWQEPAQGRTFDQFFANVASNDPAANLGELLVAAGREFVVVKKSPAGANEFSFANKRGLRILLATKWFTAYEAIPKLIERSPGVRLGVGGLEQLAIDSHSGELGPNVIPTVFSTDMGAISMPRLLSHVLEVNFSPYQRWTDALFNSWLGTKQLTPLASTVSETSPLSVWSKDSFDSNTWVSSRLFGIVGQTFTPSLAPEFLVANQSATTSFTSCKKAGTYQIWIRALRSPLGGTLSASIDGRSVGDASTQSPSLAGWSWVYIGTTSVNSGCHSIKVQVTGQLSALDEGLVASPQSVSEGLTALKLATTSAGVETSGYVDQLENPPFSTFRTLSLNSAHATIVSGVLSSATNGQLPLAAVGVPNPLSRVFAVKWTFPQESLRSAQVLQMGISTQNKIPLSELQVVLQDSYGVSAIYIPSSLPTSSKVNIWLGAPVRVLIPPHSKATTIDLNKIDQILIYSPSLSKSETRVSIQLNSAALQGRPNNEYLMFVPRSGDYRISIQMSKGQNLSNLVVGPKVVDLTNISGADVSTTFHLMAGMVTIRANIPLLSTDVVSLKSVAISSSTKNTRQESTVVTLPIDFAPQWINANGSGLHVPANWILNAYLTSGKVKETFSPERWLVIGRIISICELLSLGIGLALINRFKRKRVARTP